MIRASTNRNETRTGLKLLPYVMFLLPLLVINLGFRFLANIEHYWQEHEQSETAQQELEALTRSSTFEYQLARHAGRFSDLTEAAIKSGCNDAQLKQKIVQINRDVFSAQFPAYKLHLFRKSQKNSPAELFFAVTDKVESKRGMALIFDYLLDQHFGMAISVEIRKQKDKIAESYFGKTSRSEVFATSQKGQTTYILHEDLPHWFIWDYKEISDHGAWGYFITTRIDERSRTTARRFALSECSARGNGLGGFISLVNPDSTDVLSEKLKQSQLFKEWRGKEILPIRSNLKYWLQNGPPGTTQLGNYKIYTHLGKGADHLSVFLAPMLAFKPIPAWLGLLNIFVIALVIVFAIRGLLLNRWVETGITLRFLILYFLAATFPLGLLTVTAVAYQYQSGRSSQNQAAADIESCLKQFETSKLQIQETYQSISQRLFTDQQLINLIIKHGIASQPVKERILSCFKDGTEALPLLGFFLLDHSGKGLEYFGETSSTRVNDIVNVFRASVIQNLRDIFAANNPGVLMPDYQISEIEKLGITAMKSVSGNNMAYEIEKLRNTSIIQKYGNGTASLIYNFIRLSNKLNAVLFVAWDGGRLFEKSIKATIDSFKISHPTFSFIAFRNTPQGIKTFFREKDALVDACFLNAARAAETAAARGSFVKEHVQKFSIVAMPFGQNSEIVIVGVSSHIQLEAEKQSRLNTFILLILSSLIIAVLSAYFTATFLLKPVTELKAALDRVSEGDYSVQLTSDRKDELGNLTREFAEMIVGIKERQSLAALLSDHAVEALSANTETNNIGCDAREFRGIALVSDIRNFTTLCETYPTSDIIDMLNDHFAAMAAVIAANGGRIYKFIGDAIEAVFDETEVVSMAESALKAAIEMQCAQRELNNKRAAEGKFTCKSGVGMARGIFYAGSVGSEETRLDYSIIGETFSRAAILEAMTKNCQYLPIAFDAEIAGIVASKTSVTQIDKNSHEAMTLTTDTDWVKKVTANYSMKHESQSQQEVLPIQPLKNLEKEGFFLRNFKLVAMLIFALCAIGAGLCIYQGFVIRNQSFSRFFQNQANEKNQRLAKQIGAAGSAKVAFEMKMNQVIKNIQHELRFERQSNEAEVIKKHFAALVDEMRSFGITPGRALAVSCRPVQDEVSFLLGIPDRHLDFFLKLAQYQFKRLVKKNTDGICDQLNPRMNEILGINLDADFIQDQRYGSAMQVKNGARPEWFYWNHIMIPSPEHKAKGLPANNCELINCSPRFQRVAGIIMFAIPEEITYQIPELLISGYTDSEVELAIISNTGKTVCSKNFPKDFVALQADEALATPPSDFVFSRTEIRINNESYQLCIAHRLSKKFQINLTLVATMLSAIIALLCLYFYRSLYSITALTTSIQVKLAFSMMLTAIIPVLTVAFVSDFFLTENQRATVQQHKLEIQRYLDNFELRPGYNEPIVARMVQEFSTSPQIINLAKKLDLEPDSILVKEELHKRFASFFTKIDADDDWSSNLITRQAILISKKNWMFFHGRSKSEDAGFFAEVLSQMGKHILTRINHLNTSDDLSVKNLKGEIYYDIALQSVKSNFGDEAYIKITNAINQMVTIEVTTGAAGLMITPLPSIEKPDYFLVWMISLTRGGYFSRIATHNRGAFAVLTVEYNKYGKLSDKFMPIYDFSIEKAAAWINCSNQRVSFEQEIGHEKVSIEGRPGISQIDNFMIGIGAQTPVELETLRLRRQFNQFLLLAIIVFFIIGHQTASDIVIPVRALIEGMRQIGLQNYFYRIATDRKDELGELCFSYDRFARGLAEKEVMGRMVSKSAQKAATENLNGEIVLNSAKRNFAFIFIGSPDFVSRLKIESSEKLFKNLKVHVAQLCKIVISEGGDIDKLMGDKILGVFPVNSENPDQTYSAVIATVKEIQRVEKLGELQFPVVAGVNAGEVISGLLGFGSKRDFTVIGDAVNVTARIQKEAEKLSSDRCLFSENFVNALTDASEFKFFSETSLKGKSADCKLYRYHPKSYS